MSKDITKECVVKFEETDEDCKCIYLEHNGKTIGWATEIHLFDDFEDDYEINENGEGDIQILLNDKNIAITEIKEIMKSKSITIEELKE